MATKTGEIYYDVTLDTANAIRQQRELDAGFKQVKTSGDALTGTLKSLSGVAAAVAGALATNKIFEYADAWTTVNNKLANATKAGETQAQVTERVFQAAQNSRASLIDTANLYQRLENSTRKYVTTGYDAGRITETIAKAFAVSGATGAEMSGAITQLGQALGSGVLRGEEFNSINEQAPILMQAFADQMKVSKEEMRKLAEQGRITSDIMIKALQSIAQPVDDKFSKMVATFAQNTQIANNNLTKFIGSNATVQSAVAVTGGAFITLTNNLDALLFSVGAVAVAMTAKGVQSAASYTSALLAQLAASQLKRGADIAQAESAVVAAVADQKAAQATLLRAEAGYAAYASEKALATMTAAKVAAATATTAVATAQTALATTTSASAAAMRGLGAAFTFLTGPAGLILLAVSAFAAYSVATNDSKKPTAELATEVENLANKFKDLTKAQAEAGATKAKIAAEGLTEEYNKQKTAVKELEAEQKKAQNSVKNFKDRAAYAELMPKFIQDEKSATDALSIARGKLDDIQQRINKNLENQKTLSGAATGTAAPAKADPNFAAKYDMQLKAESDIQKERKRLIDEVNANTVESEQTKANAIFAINSDAEKKLADLRKKNQTAADKFDFTSYYLALQQEGASAFEKVGLKEREELAKNEELRKKGSITDKEAALARTAISAAAARQITEINAKAVEDWGKEWAKDAIDYDNNEQKKIEATARTQAEIAAIKSGTQGLKTGDSADPATSLKLLDDQLTAENNLKLLKKDEELAGIANREKIYADYKEALRLEQEAKLKAAGDKNVSDAAKRNSELINSYSSLAVSVGGAFGSIADALAKSGDNQSNTYKAMFAASKGFAIAAAGLNFGLALSQAMADPTALTLPQKIANYAAVATTFGGLISSISSAAYGGGRRYGGNTSAGSVYQINETGAPEMWTGSNGKSYMMGGSNGSVTSADKLGGSGVQIVINNNMAGAEVSTNTSADGKMIEIAVNQAVAAVANGISNKTGPVSRALGGATNTQWKTS